MALEATMICVDNSEWMRNGDFFPTRLQAQAEAVSLISGVKTESNPENTVGILSMAGKGPRVLTTPTTDLGKIFASMYGLDIGGGDCKVAAALQVAQLALKHRQNKNQKQRIVLFLGSPVNVDKKELEDIGRRLRKNSVAIDVVNFGEEETEKLEALVGGGDGGGGEISSRVIDARPGGVGGSDCLYDFVLGYNSSEILGGGDGDYVMEEDELVAALRESLEEEMRRQEEALKQEGESSGGGGHLMEVDEEELVHKTHSLSLEEEDEDDEDEEEDLIQKAMALSLEDSYDTYDCMME